MRPLVILKLLFQKLFLVLVGPLQLLLLLFIFLLELQFPGICRPLLRLQDLIHLQPESLDLLLRLRLRVLDLLADRRMRLLDLLSGFLLRRADLLPRPLLLHPGRVLRLRDLQIRRLALLILIHIEEHPQPVSVVVRAVDQIHIRPPLRSVRPHHLEHPQIRIFRQQLQMLLGQPLLRVTRHFQPVERILRDLLREPRHTQPELLRIRPAHIDRTPVPRLPGQNTQGPRYFGQNIGCRCDLLPHLRVYLVESCRLLEYTVIDRVIAFLVGRRADHAVLEAISVLAVESHADRQMAVRPLDLSELGADLLAILLRGHEEGIPLHLLLKSILPVPKLLPEIIIIKKRLEPLVLHVGEDQDAARQILRKLPDLIHPRLAGLLRHVYKCDLKVLPALADCHAAAKIDGILLLLGYEIDLICYRRNIRSAIGTLDRNNVHIVALRFRCHLLCQKIPDFHGCPEMEHLLGRDPDHIIGHILQTQVRIPAAEKAIQKILSKIDRCLHIPIITNNNCFGARVTKKVC